MSRRRGPEMPEAFALPGAAYLQQLDDLAHPVDWTARLAITPGAMPYGKHASGRAI
ncbi:hypothetical protein [Streptomyces sp. URMC 123]|uniref:hypothetical protein n=1 Tax=Streptomyces sp. URMC 123 TaxID=3423403 RepID=UPI003F19BB41